MRHHKTEDNSHASEDNHLSGIGAQFSDYVLQNFCIKMSSGSNDEFEFMPGAVLPLDELM